MAVTAAATAALAVLPLVFRPGLLSGTAGRAAWCAGLVIAGLLLGMQLARQRSNGAGRLLFAQMPGGFALHEIICNAAGTPRDYRFLDINPAFERLTGLSRAEVIGRTVREVLPRTEDAWIERYGHVALTGEPVHFVDHSATLDRTFEVLAFSPQRGRFAVIFLDITEQKLREQEQAKIQKLESLGILAGGIAHDFNNVLAVVLGNLHLVRMNDPPLDEETRILLNEAETASLRAKGLTQQLLTFAKGGLPVKQVCDLGPVIRDAATGALHGSASRVEFQLAPDLWRVEADPGQVGQVIQQLTANADQAMPEGGAITIRARNVVVERDAIHLPQPGRYIAIVIADTGAGIPPQHLDRLFDPYFTTKKKGSGLGLATSLSIVRKHGGRITVESAVGRGSTFRVYIPATDKPIEPVPEPDLESIPKGSGRILVVDDEEPVRRLTARMLERVGYEVAEARDGDEAVRRFEEGRQSGRPFRVAVLDLTIPGGKNGVEILKDLRRLDPNTKAVIASGYATDPVMATYREHGFSGVVTKPFRLAELARVIAQAARAPDTPPAPGP
ncbi:MAG: response regulator [Kiritimatiellae bacterium]|nr:response regulator [Kiritimatiellia bacterium]